MNISVCPICNSPSSLPYHGFGAPNRAVVHNRVCNVCGIVFQSPRAAFNELKEYYEEYSQQTIPQNADIPIRFEEQVLSIARLRLQFLRPFLREGARVLDIGCSFGAMLKVLRDESGLNLHLTGVNPEASFARFGQKNYKLDIRIGMFEDQAFAPASFDFIILDNVIEHFDDHNAAIRAIHELLDHDGKLFVATNNLYEPHGFLWQNFFADHTVTFSPTTLKMLLESQGLPVITQDFSGHTTYEGYHYPYQYCLAQKGPIPSSYAYAKNGDSAEDILKRRDEYIARFFSSQGIAKRLYELSVGTVQTSEEAAEFLSLQKYKLILAAKNVHMSSNGSPLEGGETYHAFNHTLPPEEYFHRRVVVAVCYSDNDVYLAMKQIEQSCIAPVTYIVRHHAGAFVLQSAPDLQLKALGGYLFSGLDVFWGNLLVHSPRIDSGVFVHLNNADLPDDVLRRAFHVYHASGKAHAYVDYRQFTGAHLEFFAMEMFRESQGSNCCESTLLPVFDQAGAVRNDTLLIWPDSVDYEYFYRERFNNYFQYPKAITLDLSPACNKVCDKCQFHSSRSPFASLIQRDQIMPKELAFKVIDEAATWPVKPVMSLTYSGEALLYPHLFEVIKHAKSRDLAVTFFTNGVLLDENVGKMLIDLHVDSITVSIDAFDSSTYEQLQAPDHLSVVVHNVERLVAIRGNGSIPSVGVHFVMEPRNESQFGNYLHYWKDRVDSVSSAIMQDQFNSCRCVLPYSFQLGERQACWAAWNNLYIRWDGKVSFCGFDIDGNKSGLSVYNKCLQDIWHSAEFWRWRNAQLNNDHSVLYCKACPDWAGLRSITSSDDKLIVSKTPFTETYSKKIR